jgi:hypothetical protein
LDESQWCNGAVLGFLIVVLMQHWYDPRAKQASLLFVHLMNVLQQNIWRLAYPPENYACFSLARYATRLSEFFLQVYVGFTAIHARDQVHIFTAMSKDKGVRNLTT